MEFVYNDKKREMEYKDLPAELQDVPCLEDKEIIELAKVSKKIEGYFGCPQDSEWVISKSLPFPENVFLVQTRPETVWSKKQKGPLLGQKSGLEMLIERAITPTKVKM